MGKENIKSYKKRKALYWIYTIFLVLLWYGITGLESSLMGLHPLIRRQPTLFDILFYIAIISGFVILHLWYRKCPKCKKKMKWSGISPYCDLCGFGNKPIQKGS